MGSTKAETIAFSPAYIHLCWKLWPKNMFLHHLKIVCFLSPKRWLFVRSMTWDLQTLLPVACFLSGVPGDSGILGANTMVATVFQALGPYSPLLCQHPSLSFDKKMEDMKAPPGWDAWGWAWDGMEPGNTWWTEWWIWHLRFLYQSTCIILIYIYIFISFF